MNRSRLAALSAGAMFLVASVFVPATASADTGNTNTIKVLGSPNYNPPVASGSFTVNVVANGSVAISGAAAGLTFDTTKLQLTAIAKTVVPADPGTPPAYAGFPTAAQLAGFLTAVNSGGTFGGNPVVAGTIPAIGWSYTDGSSVEPANGDEGIFSATFSIIASGDSTLEIPTGISTAILSGQIPGYGDPLTVTPVNGVVRNSFQPIWSLSAPASASVLTGATTDVTVSTAVTQGNPGAIDLTASGLPAGVTAAFAPASGTNAFSSTLTFTAATQAVPGTYPVTVSANASGVIKTQTISLTVAQNGDFSFTVSPSAVSVTGGGSASNPVTVSVANLTGDLASDPVSFRIDTLPVGISGSIIPPDAAIFFADGSFSLTFQADGTATAGTVPVIACASNSLVEHCVTITLNVIVITGAGAIVNVNGDLDSGFLGLTCPTSLTIPLLRGNTNQLNVPCQVYTNTVWNLNVNDPKTTNKGHMTTADATPAVMPDSMHVLSRSFLSTGEVFYGNNVDLATGTGTTCSALQQPCLPANQGTLSGGTILAGTNSASAPLVLSQYVAPNTQPGSYGINVVFTAVSVF